MGETEGKTDVCVNFMQNIKFAAEIPMRSGKLRRLVHLLCSIIYYFSCLAAQKLEKRFDMDLVSLQQNMCHKLNSEPVNISPGNRHACHPTKKP